MDFYKIYLKSFSSFQFLYNKDCKYKHIHKKEVKQSMQQSVLPSIKKEVSGLTRTNIN